MIPDALVMVPLLAGAAAGLVGWTLSPLWQPSPLAARALALRPARRERASRWPAVAAWVTAHASAAALDRAQARAAQAGWGGDAAAWLIVAERGLPLLLPLVGSLFLLSGRDAVQGPALLVLLAIAGRLGPGLYAANMAARRIIALRRGLPDAIDLLVICAESGLGIDAALARTGRELAPAHPALAAELRLTAVELGFLPNRADALANLAQRVPIALVAGLGTVLTQTERFGTPLAQALRTMAAEARTARLLAAEARAARLPALMTVPMIVFVLPPLFVVLIGPAIVSTLSR